MCGIIGIFNHPDASSLVVQGLQQMRNRGLDGYGITDANTATIQSSPETLRVVGNCALGHALHAIVNSVPEPIQYKKSWLSANCEIYNWKELCETHSLRAKNDAELLLQLLVTQGLKKTLSQVRGVYAFIWWQENTVTIARDIIGVKPLWYSKDNGFLCASEKKALLATDTVELNPREILQYDITTKKITRHSRSFSQPLLKRIEESTAVKQLDKILSDAMKIRIPKQQFGVLYSGGIDSVLIAQYLKKHNASFTCYVVGTSFDAPDVLRAKHAAKEQGLLLKTVILPPSKIHSYLKTVVPLIEDSNVVKVGVGLTLYAGCEQARKDGCKVIFSGSGADEIFAGYHRHKQATDLAKDCYSDILKIYEKNCYRDDVVSMNNALELRVPFLDLEVVQFGLSLPPSLRVQKDTMKFILRKIAEHHHIPSSLYNEKKQAAQYGSAIDKAIAGQSKKQGYKAKSAYLNSFYSTANVKLAALVSSGKDSIYALYTMMQQNYDISCLVTVQSSNLDSYMFHTPTTDFVKQQSKSLNIPLIVQSTRGEKEKELQDLKEVLQKAKNTYGVEGVVSGALYSTYQRERIEKICDELGLKMFAPLWHLDQETYLRELLKKGFRFILTKIAAQGLDKSWLGKEITSQDVDKLITLSKKHGLNPAGEGGEYESLMINGPIFSEKIEYKKLKKKMESECVGFLS